MCQSMKSTSRLSKGDDDEVNQNRIETNCCAFFPFRKKRDCRGDLILNPLRIRIDSAKEEQRVRLQFSLIDHQLTSIATRIAFYDVYLRPKSDHPECEQSRRVCRFASNNRKKDIFEAVWLPTNENSKNVQIGICAVSDVNGPICWSDIVPNNS